MFIQISEFKMHYNYSIGLDNTAEKNLLNTPDLLEPRYKN